MKSAERSHWPGDVRRIATLAWPVFAGQIAVLAFSTVDTLLIARHAALDLAALAVGAATYVSVFVGLMGVVLAIGPIAGQHFGARQLRLCGQQLHQAAWLALGLALLGALVLLFPQPFLNLAKADAAVAAKVRGYLAILAVALPAALLFTAFRGFATAISRPKAVMALQLGGLVLKVPASALLIYGFSVPTPWGTWQQAALGLSGCAVATALVMWLQLLGAILLLRHDPFYADLGLQRFRLDRPDRAALRALLRLGVPMGLSILIEVTGFTFMAFFISRLGATPVAGHQIAANMIGLMFMLPLALANATSTLVAQHIGAGTPASARRIGWHGLQMGIALGAITGTAVFLGKGLIVRVYTQDPAVIAAALPMLTWVGLFHVCDAMQVLAAFVLRAYRIATAPLIANVIALWGVGLAGGYALAFDIGGGVPSVLQGAPGFWFAATLGLLLAGIGMSAYLARVFNAQRLAAG